MQSWTELGEGESCKRNAGRVHADRSLLSEKRQAPSPAVPASCAPAFVDHSRQIDEIQECADNVGTHPRVTVHTVSVHSTYVDCMIH